MKKIFLSAILAGAVIAFGGTVFLSVENTVVGSIFFTIGLFVVCTRCAVWVRCTWLRHESSASRYRYQPRLTVVRRE